MAESIENKYFGGQEIIYPKLSHEANKWNEKELKRIKEYTQKVNHKYQGELAEFAEIAKNFSFEEILVSEDAENPYVLLSFPKKQIVPERYLQHYSEVIKKIVPEKRTKEALEIMFFHERLHSTLEEAASEDEITNKFYDDLAQTEKQLEKLRSKKENTQDVKERLRLEIEERELSEKHSALEKKISDLEDITEMEVNRKIIKESPNLDAIVSLSLIELMLSDGII